MAQGLTMRQNAPSDTTRDWFGDTDNLWPSALKPAAPVRRRRHTDLNGNAPTSVSHSRSASNLMDRVQTSQIRPSTLNRSASNLLDGKKTQHRSIAQSETRSQAIADLIEFLRTYEPPAESWTSQPFDDTERGRWSRLRSVGGLVKRSKSVPKQNQQFRLPDSAVSGTTTGGHRHIAISIPMEASPFGLMPRSQYPVYHQTVAQHNPDPASPFRYLNDKGVITVLRPLNENRAQTSIPGFRITLPPCPGPPPSKELPSTHEGGRSSASRGSRPATARFTTEQSDQPLLGDPQHTISPRAPRSNQALASPPMRTSSAHGVYPSRTVPAMHNATIARPSIDGIIAKNTVNPRPVQDKKPRPISESSATEDEEPILGKAEHQIPLTRSQSNRELSMKTRQRRSLENNGSTLITENPLATMAEQETPPETPLSANSRRERVRKLKQRDMATLRQSAETKGDTTSRPHTAMGTESTDPTARYAPINTLSPIMIVTSIEPVEASPRKMAWNDRKPKGLGITPPSSGYICKVEKHPVNGKDSGAGEPSTTKSLTIPQARRAKARASLSPLSAKKSCNPTPPLSPARSPRRANSLLDRTSLSRRREWNASRNKARRVQDVVEAVKSKIQDAARNAESVDEVDAARRDQAFLKLYEAYREHRLRDMERRVRRLERHGDVWMRALVPVLDNLNRSITSGHQPSKIPEEQGWRSDDEPEVLRRGRSKHRSLPILSKGKQPYTADYQGQGRADLDDEEEEEEEEENPRDSDDSGLDTLEPLMRELAGAARERLKTQERMTGIAM
ncbi:hypothetical protein LIA77_10310 [Sarocladium implicatum]|nr:hypothetical protein LIA77_10310 [Sarocladium implicatum]